MKGKIKLLSLLLALAMVASMFVACDSAPAANNGGEAGDEIVEIDWWHWGSAPTQMDNAVKALNEKSAADIKVTVDFKFQAAADKTQTALATGEKGDVVFVCSWWCNYLNTAQKGQLADISEEVKKHDDLMALVPDWAWEAATVNGGIYAVPVMKDSAAQQFWLINKDFVQDGAGVTDEELDTMGKALSTVTPILEKVKAYADANGGVYNNGLTAAFNYNKAGLNGYFNGWDMVGACQIGDNQDEDGVKVEWAYDNAENIANLKESAYWYANGLVNQDCAQVESEPSDYCVATAQGWYGAELSSWGVGKDYTVVIRERNKAFANRASVLGACNGVFANSEHLEAAVKYLAYCSTNADYRNMLAYGAPDVDWKDNGDGTVTKLSQDWAPGSFAQACTWIMKPVAPAPASMYKDIEAMSKAAAASELMGFTFDISNVENEIAAVDSAMAQYQNGLMCGTYTDVDATIAAMKAEAEAAGLNTILAEVEAQVAAYMG